MIRVRHFASTSRKRVPDYTSHLKLPPRPPLWKLGWRSLNILKELGFMKLRQIRGVPVNIRAVKMRETFIRLGPAFVKAGQALATRPDVGFPPEVTDELAKLQDRMPPFSSDEAKRLIASELNLASVSDKFEYLSDVPIAAASLGQVYRGRLKPRNNEDIGVEVAVKVQRPGLNPIVELDVHVLRSVAFMIQYVFDVNSDIVGVTDQLVGRILEEIDYRNEAKFATKFGDLYRSEQIVVPYIIPSLSSERILTMEWVDGVPLSELALLTEQERMSGDVSHLDPSPIIERGVICSLEQLLEIGFFHGDPHPGNLMVTRKGQLAYLDFGMMGELDRQSRLDMLQLLVNFVNKDATAMAIDFSNLGFIPQDVSIKAVNEQLVKVFATSKPSARLDFQGVLLELSEVMYDFSFKVPPRFALVIRALGALEGTVIKVDPSFKVVARAYPHVLGQLLRDRSPEMRHILASLIVDPQGQVRWKRLEAMIKAANVASLEDNKKDDEFSSALSMDVACALTDAMSLVCLPQNGKMRRVLIEDGSQALDRIIDEILTGRQQSDYTKNTESDESRNSSPPSPDAINGVLGRFSSLIKAAPAAWMNLAMETVESKQGKQFCSQLTQKVVEKSSWRGGQWAIFATANALRSEHTSWKNSNGKRHI